ncbi:hypothetical protein ACIBL8_44580 [Streptomyces sp. NPDC050523]
MARTICSVCGVILPMSGGSQMVALALPCVFVLGAVYTSAP